MIQLFMLTVSIILNVFFSSFFGIHLSKKKNIENINPSHFEMRENDSLALVELFNATNGINWTYTTPLYWDGIDPSFIPLPNTGNAWNFNMPIDTWHGVELDENGRVITLVLSKNNLSGSLPLNINLPKLKHFRCTQNKLTGNIPDFSNLTELEYLFLHFNEFTGNIPDFSNIINSRIIWVNNNNLTGEIPNFSKLENLESFSCRANGLTGNIPDLTNTPMLKSLIVGDNKLSGSIPDFKNLEKLVAFYCGSNILEGEIPNFSKMPNLKTLHCYDNNLEGGIPNFSNLNKLESISCEDNNLTGNIPNFDNCPNLEELVVFHNSLSGNIPDLSTNCPNIRRLYLNNNFLTGCIPDEMSVFCSLEKQSYEDFYLSASQQDTLYYYDKDGYNLSNNPQLPWQGDFSRFCNGESQIGASCDDGDANTSNDVIQEDCFCKGIAFTCNRQADSLELIKFYNHFNGANWTYNNAEEYWNYRGGLVELVPNAGNAWLEGPINQWHGVELTSDGCIDRLILQNMNITGTFIQLDFPELDGIYLHDNNITGGLIDWELPKLTKLFINSNPIGGSLIDFQNIPNIQSFIANGCEFEGNLIDFTGMPNLRELQLGGNFLTGDIPDFQHIPELGQLHLSGDNKFNFLPNFTNLKSLLTLGLIHCGVTNLPDFDNCPNLYGLYLIGCAIEHEIPDFTDNCPNLRSIWLSENQLTFEDILPSIKVNSDLVTTNKIETEDGLIYESQAKIFKDTIIQVSENSDLSIDLKIDEGIQTNVYQWFKNTEAFQTVTGNNNLEFQNIQLTDAGVYTVEITNPQAPNLILQSHNITINIKPLVEDLSYNVTVNTTCPAESEGSFELTLNGGIPPYQLRWSSLDNTQTGEEIIGVGENLLVESLATGLYNVSISDDLSIVTNIDVIVGEKTEGCREKGIAPQVITPNGDGLNETFEVDELNDNPQKYPDNELIIVNRWGDVVYQAKPYRNDWSGTNRDGKELPVATYYYVLKLDIGEGEIKQGYITVIR